MNDVLGLDELALVFQACPRGIEGLKLLCSCERVCRSWRDALQSAEGADAFYRVATGPWLRDVWPPLEALHAAPAPNFAALVDKPAALASKIAGLKKAGRDTAALARLGGVPCALVGDPDGEVNVFAEDDAAAEWHYALDPAADVTGDRAIRSQRPFPPLEKFAEEAPETDRQAAAEADGIASYWAASQRDPRRVHTHVWQPRLDAAGALEFVPLECLYFEVSLDRRAAAAHEEDECVAVGLGTARFPLSGSQPGWKIASVGYHSDDGNLFRATGNGRPYGPRFGDGDTVGCGICLLTRTVFFTHNGTYLGVAVYDWIGDRELFPIVGVGSHTRGTLRFGTSVDKPAGGFMFDPASWPACRADSFRRKPPAPPPVRQRLPAGLEALESLEPEHPSLVALLQMLQQLGIYHADEDEDEDEGSEEEAAALAALAQPMEQARAAYLRQLVARLGHVEDGDFVLREDETDDDDDDDDDVSSERLARCLVGIVVCATTRLHLNNE